MMKHVPEQIQQTIGRAMGRIPSGVFILTAGSAAEKTAMMASWVQQAGFEPAAVSVAIAKERPIGDLIRRDKRFVLNVIGEKDHHIMRKYARGLEPGVDPFEGVVAGDPHPFDAEIRHHGWERTAQVTVRRPHERVGEVPFDYRELATCIVNEIHRHAANHTMEEAARAAEAMMKLTGVL